MVYKCDKCGKRFDTRKQAEKHEKNCKKRKGFNKFKFIEGMDINAKIRNKKTIKEIRCKCNSCGKVWHFLPEEEKRAKSGKCWSAYGQMSCCLPMQLYSKHEGLKWQDKLDKFKKCPKCGSVNITKKELEYAK